MVAIGLGNKKFCGINQCNMKNFFNLVLTILLRFIITVSGLVMIYGGWSMFTEGPDLVLVLAFTISTITFISILYWIGKIQAKTTFLTHFFSVFR